MNGIERLEQQIDFLLKNPKSAVEAFHSLSTVYVLVSETLRANQQPTQKDFMDYFEVHRIYMSAIERLIPLAPDHQQVHLKDFRKFVKDLHTTIQKDYERKNSFFRDLAIRFCR